MIHKCAILLAVSYIIEAIAWDVVLAIFGDLPGNSFCQACREINAASDALLAIGSLGLWIHIFLLPWLPSFWRHS